MARKRIIVRKYKKATIPQRLRNAVILRDRGICQNCGFRGKIFSWLGKIQNYSTREWSNRYEKYIAMEIGHIIPEFKGGKTILENLILLCRDCNRSLGIKLWQHPQVEE